MHYLLVALGGALGAMARYSVYNAGPFPGQKAHWTTFLINAAGSLLIGVAYVALTEKGWLPAEWRSFATVGFLGAFTTYSTYSLDAWLLLEQGQTGAAGLYLVGTMLVCCLAVFAGVSLARIAF